MPPVLSTPATSGFQDRRTTTHHNAPSPSAAHAPSSHNARLHHATNNTASGRHSPRSNEPDDETQQHDQITTTMPTLRCSARRTRRKTRQHLRRLPDLFDPGRETDMGHMSVYLTSEDCARCGVVCGGEVFCHGCRIEAKEYEAMGRWGNLDATHTR